MSQTNDDDDGQRLRPLGEEGGREGEGDFPISPIDEVGRALARFHNAVNSRARAQASVDGYSE